jgi:hypothetical protein
MRPLNIWEWRERAQLGTANVRDLPPERVRMSRGFDHDTR